MTDPGPARAEPSRSPAEALRRHPGFLAALAADTRLTSAQRGRPLGKIPPARLLAEAARLAWESDGFPGLMLYRAKARLQSLGVPVLPRILHRLATALSGVRIGDPVHVEAGINVGHGAVVIDGITEIGAGTRISPFVTIGLVEGSVAGPRIGRDVKIGTGAKVLGAVTIGDGARIGANAVVIDDVPAGATVVGVPARAVAHG